MYICYGELRGSDPKFLESKGFKVYHLPMQPGGLNFFKDIRTMYYIWKLLKKLQPDIVHLVTVKPYLYGGIISRLVGVPSLVSAVSGLGTLFIDKNIKNKFLRILLHPIYKIAFNHINQKIIVQNNDDLKTLLNWGVLNPNKASLLKGSGVDLAEFSNLQDPKGKFTICFAGRILKDKGVREFIKAASIIRERGKDVRFILAGDFDENNPSGISIQELAKINEGAYVEILGYQKNISKLYEQSHVICLPSYREGLPKSLIEAAAAGRAVVTTDVPGCRDAIIPNITGILVPSRDSLLLANAFEWLIEHPKKRILMGEAARKFAEKEFPIEKIVIKHIDIYKELLSNN